MEIALSGICGNDDVICPITSRDEIAREAITGRTANNYSIPFKNYSWKEKIAFILYTQKQQFYNHIPASELITRLPQKTWDEFFTFCFDRNPWDKVIAHYFQLNRNGRYKSLSEYLESGRWEVLHGHKMYCIGSKPVVDAVFKYEEMEESLAEISEQLGLKYPLKLHEYRAKSEFRKDRRHYREFLTESQAAHIADIFARDIELMGYSY